MHKGNGFMKKEYLILVALIILLGAYLLFHKENKNNYTLPEIAKIDTAKITGLIINKGKNPISLTKNEKTWVVSDKKYPADSSSLENIFDTLKTLKLSALVSENEDLRRYDLDEENSIQVKVITGQTKAFEFTMGKTAPSFNHTFIRLTDDKNIYHATGNFRAYFDKTIEDFRDKKVMEFKKDSIKQVFIEKEGLSKTLVSVKGETSDSVSWRSEDGAAADKETVSNLLSAVSFLKCEKYLNDTSKKKFENEKPLVKLDLKNNINLSLFKTDAQDNLIGISSMNEYVFELSQFNAKEIESNIEKLLGIVKKEEIKD